jgi:hypothetical protein
MSTGRPPSVAAIPIVGVVVAIALMVAAPAPALPTVLTVLNATVKILALAGAVAAALAFDRGDYLRRGWGLCAACYVFLLLRDASLHLAPGPESTAMAVFRALCVVVGNTCMVLGAWTLAGAWAVAGLELSVSTRARRGVMALAIGASLVFAGPAIVADAALAFGGRWDHLWTVASDLGDLLALPVIAPVALIALTISGGSLRWPWLLFAVSLGAWLLYDAILFFPTALVLDDAPFRAPAEVCRVLAGTSACAAGLAQRLAVRDIEQSE